VVGFLWTDPSPLRSKCVSNDIWYSVLYCRVDGMLVRELCLDGSHFVVPNIIEFLCAMYNLCLMRCGDETAIGGVGNKKVTSKRNHTYQRRDGEASISHQ